MGGGLQDFIVSPSPLWVNFGFELGWDWVLGDSGQRGWGLGLDNSYQRTSVSPLTSEVTMNSLSDPKIYLKV